MGQNVRAFRHEVDAAENNEVSLGARGFLGKFVGISAEVGKTYDFIALIMMAQDYCTCAEGLSGSSKAGIHGVIGKDEIVVERAAFSPPYSWSNSSRHNFFRLQFRDACVRNGDVESIRRLQ